MKKWMGKTYAHCLRTCKPFYESTGVRPDCSHCCFNEENVEL